MASTIDFSQFSFSAEQIRNINELVYEGIAKLPELSFIHQMYSGIVYDKEIGFITGAGLVGKKGQGCNPEAQDWAISTRKKTWAPKEWEVFLDECADDLKNTMVIYSMNKGTRIDDLTDTDYMAIVVEVLIDALKKFFYRLIWFNDTDALAFEEEEVPTCAVSAQTGETISGTVYKGVTASTEGAIKGATAAGVVVYTAEAAASGAPESGATYYTRDSVNKTTINNGGTYSEDTDTDYFDIIDGLFKQLRAAYASDASIHVNITANEAATKALQLSGMTGDVAYALLSSMYYASPVKMRENKANLRFLVTQTIADAYEQYLVGKGIESTYKNLVEGISAPMFNGIPVVAMPIWDENIQSYQDLGDTFYFPHRALLCEKRVLAVGTPSTEVYGELDLWYDKTSRKNYILVKDRLDAKLLDEKSVIYAE